MKLGKKINTISIILMVAIWEIGAATVDDLAPRTFLDGNGHTLPYRLFTPSTGASTKVPLILFFHGAYERGTDNRSQAANNTPLMLLDPANQATNPCFFVAPQCPGDQQWVDMPWGASSGTQPASPTWPMAAAMKMVDSLMKEFPAIDPARIYVMGLSMGGYGTWDAICRWPDRFAAAIAICGGGDSSKVAPIVSMPIWAFHSADDGTVPVTRTRQMITAIKNRGGNPKYTEFCTNGLPCYNHYSWGPSYDEPGLWPWLFNNTKSHRLRMSDSLISVDIEIGKPRQAHLRVISVVNLYPEDQINGLVTITHKSSWLSISVNAANPDSQVITNTIDASALPDVEQKYYDTVTVHVNNSSIQDQSYRVFMWIRETQVLSDFSIIPHGTGSLSSDKPFRFSAVAKDQYGTPLSPQPGITWTATGGSIDANGLFTPGSAGSTAQIIASTQGAVPVKDTAIAVLVSCTQGLSYDFYKGKYLATVNAIATLTPSQSGVAPNVSLDQATTADSFALRFNGYVFVPVSGSYTFYLTSDDGSALSIDGNKIIDNDGPHGAVVKSAAVSLGWGLHAISVLFFEQGWGQILTLNWQGPGITGMGPIPDSLLFNAPGGATSISKNAGNYHSDLIAKEMASISVKGKGLFVDAPEGINWEMELFTLNGVKILNHAGRGNALVPFIRQQCSGNNFVIARVKTSSGTTMKILTMNSSLITPSR